MALSFLSSVCRALAAALGCPSELLVFSAYQATVPAELRDLWHHGSTAPLEDPLVQECLPLVAALRPLLAATRREHPNSELRSSI